MHETQNANKSAAAEADTPHGILPAARICGVNLIQTSASGPAEVESSIPPAPNGMTTAPTASQPGAASDATCAAARPSRNSSGKHKKAKKSVTTGDVLRYYVQHNCPDRDRRERQDTALQAEVVNVGMLRPFFEDILPEDITPADCDDYHDKRIKEVKEGCEGHRTVDIELTTLRNALWWACRRRLIKKVPMHKQWPKYTRKKDVQHCKKFKADDADEVHEIGGYLFVHGKSMVLAFLWIFENLTGVRTIEALGLRTDAEPHTPGWLKKDGKELYVRRAKNQEDVNPFVDIHEGLQEWLEAHRIWKAKYYPDSPWFFPSPYDPSQPLSKGALSKALRRLRKILKRKITPHGARAFYVMVRRSHGVQDVQIAFHMGHESKGKTMAEVYGAVPPSWLRGDGPRLSWLPKGPRAWEAENGGAKPASSLRHGRLERESGAPSNIIPLFQSM
ncbi:MAG: tyrosine-type recombinase/integrase [Limisphaerales bacterium]